MRVAPGVLLSLTLFSQPPRRPDVVGDFLLAAYVAASSTVAATAGFLIPIAFSQAWHGLRVRRAAIVAGALGMFAPVVTLLVAPVIALPLLPLFRSAVWMGIVLFHGIPGMLLGGVAILFARRSSPATPGAGAV